MTTIYVVTGECGEYSDWTKWLVAAYADEQAAQRHAEAGDAWIRTQGEMVRGLPYQASYAWRTTHPNPYDDHNPDDYYDTSYTVEEIPFHTVDQDRIHVSHP